MQPHFFAAEEDEDDRALRFMGQPRVGPADLHDRGAAAGVVVGPGKEEPHVESVMVEVAADDDDLFAQDGVRAFDVAGDVVADSVGVVLGFDRVADARLQGKAEGLLEVLQDLLEVDARRPGLLEDHVGRFFADHGRQEALQPVAVGIGDRLGVDIKEAQGALVQGRFHPGAVLVVALQARIAQSRLAAEAEDDLALDVQAGVVIVAQVGGADAPAGENQPGLNLAAVAEEQGQIVLVGLQLFPRGLAGQDEGQLGAFDDRVRGRVGLEVARLGVDGLEAPLLVEGRGPLGRRRKAVRAGQAAGEGGRRQLFHVAIGRRPLDGGQPFGQVGRKDGLVLGRGREGQGGDEDESEKRSGFHFLGPPWGVWPRRRRRRSISARTGLSRTQK